MTQIQTHPKLAKIKALLAKAEDPAALPEEAELYFAKAAELMAEYGIEQAMLADAKPETDKIGERTFNVKGKYMADRSSLLFAIAHALGARNVYWSLTDPLTRKRYRRVRVYAHESTLSRIELLFSSLQLQALNGVQHARSQYGESTIAYRKSWLAGFASSVRNRLDEAEESALRDATREAGTAGAELVLVKREEAVAAFFKRAHPKIKTAPSRRLTGTGWGDGRAAGERADLGRGHLSGNRPKALSR
ncbi:DUF2786 domain-containing protein [Streptomyces sp. NPDC005774]|uniref:DUF2786 domain-containing protein n=1 Tax=Streptomyces sp. NPDC005774 TaxID=3364728 RepID=UPI003681539D